MSLVAPGVARPERPEAAPLGGGAVPRIWWGVVWSGIGALLGAHALSDNSFLTHLATGRLIRGGGVPRVDPYSFLARGRAWVVQSWSASWLYAVAEAATGLWGVRMVMVAATALLCALLWRLSARAGALLPRLVITGVAVAYGASWWSERPQLLGFCCLALTLLVLDEERSPWWLIPIFAFWVNVHGSFPVGLVVVALWSLVIAKRSRRLALAPPGTALLGCALGGLLSPFGVDQLTFPVRMLGRSEVLRYIVEWRRASLSDPSTWVFLAIVAAACWLVVRRRAWWALLVVVVVAGLAASSQRNIAIGVIVLVPVVAATIPTFGSFAAACRPPLRSIVVGVTAVLVASGLLVVATPDLDLGPYPVRAVDWMDARGIVAVPSVRVVSPDYVGNYLAFRYGAAANVYLDDRAEVFTASEISGYVELLTANGWSRVLRSVRADVVLWPRNKPLAGELARSGDWNIGYRDTRWIVACRADAMIDCVPS